MWINTLKIFPSTPLSALLATIAIGMFASSSEGQSPSAGQTRWMGTEQAIPLRFRPSTHRRMSTSSQPAFPAKPRPLTHDEKPRTPVSPARPTAAARQALWHAQSARERHTIAQTVGFADGTSESVGIGSDWGSVEDSFRQRGGRSGNSNSIEYEDPFQQDGALQNACQEISCDGTIGNFADDGNFGHDACGCGGNCFDCLRSLSPFQIYGMGDLQLIAGVQGFTNAINAGRSGSFGFHEGFNFGTAVPFLPYSGWGFQVGMRLTQSNLDGTATDTDQRSQVFGTVGLFRRNAVGWQAGLVVDTLNDNWIGNAGLSQLRGSIGWKPSAAWEYGYWFAAGGATDTITGPAGTIRLNITDVQAFYLRLNSTIMPGANARFMVGTSNNSNGILTAEVAMPLSTRWSMMTDAAYLVPDEPTGRGAAEREAWNLGLSFVFSLRGRDGCGKSPYAPLFRVAGNGTMFVDAD